MNEQLKYILITFLVPIIMIILGVMGISTIIMMTIAITWIGVSLLIFHPLEEE